MGKRVLVAVICIPIIFLSIYWLFPLFPVTLPIAVAALSALAVHEALWSAGFLKHFRISTYSILLAAVIPFWVFYDGRPLPALCAVFIYIVLLFAEAMGSHKKVTVEKMGGVFFLSVFIPFFLSSFLRICQMTDWEYYILLPFIVSFISDSFALFSGMLFGKHKLAPELSPKKTVEGAVGGFLCTILITMLYGLILNIFFAVQPNYLLLGLYGALGSAVAQFGDLSFSYMKREYGIKDFGNVFPGHGGVLDRFDSVIFAAPLIELLIRYLPALGG